MACASDKEISFMVYELYPDGSKAEGKPISISKQDNDEMMNKFGYAPNENGLDNYGIVLTIFHKIYNFTIGLHGFNIRWDTDENGQQLMFKSGCIYWPGPRAPAYNCGGEWWRIERI